MNQNATQEMDDMRKRAGRVTVGDLDAKQPKKSRKQISKVDSQTQQMQGLRKRAGRITVGDYKALTRKQPPSK